MRWSSLVFLGLSLSALGCDSSERRTAAGQEKRISQSEGALSDLKHPQLQGLAVANDPEGAVVVSCEGCTSSPGTTVLGEYPVGTVFTSVNGTRVRDAVHFREMTDEAFAKGEALNLGMLVNARG